MMNPVPPFTLPEAVRVKEPADEAFMTTLEVLARKTLPLPVVLALRVAASEVMGAALDPILPPAELSINVPPPVVMLPPAP